MTAELNVWLRSMRLPQVNHKRVQRLMRQAGLHSVIRRKTQREAKIKADYVVENILNREFTRSNINEVWVSDSTQVQYGKRAGRKIWLCGVLDLYSGELLGWSLSQKKTTQAAIIAFDQAFERFPLAHPLVHTDRGSAYTSFEFRNYLDDHQVPQSMSRPGTPHDNAVIESFWSQFKTEWLLPRTRQIDNLAELANLINDGLNYFMTERRTLKHQGLTPFELRETILKKN
ncbi:transposase [Xylocopilactobacillus apicola]|uniref:Transposase n=2 Tax=Xylocopilactobacillus apicola TaxID=2932184 RepID=A0AAU9D804_9LACO|nr:transposase [Xylocopilactobacillus apicola]